MQFKLIVNGIQLKIYFPLTNFVSDVNFDQVSSDIKKNIKKVTKSAVTLSRICISEQNQIFRLSMRNLHLVKIRLISAKLFLFRSYSRKPKLLNCNLADLSQTDIRIKTYKLVNQFYPRFTNKVLLDVRSNNSLCSPVYMMLRRFLMVLGLKSGK